MGSKERKVYRQLLEILGQGVVLASVDRERAREVIETFRKLPSDSNSYRGKTVAKIIEAVSDDEKKFSAKNVNDYLGIVTGLFDYAIKELGVESYINHFDDSLRVPEGRRKDKRDPFSREDLKKIFSGNFFVNFNRKKNKPHTYWAPLIALYTGARNNEVGSLKVSDIRPSLDESGNIVKSDIDGKEIWFFSINRDESGLDEVKDELSNTLKNDNSVRQVPIHPKLIELGFLEYRDQVRKKGDETMLFDYLVFSKSDKFGGLIGRNFNDYLKDIKMWVRLRKVFYSFRHTIYNELTNQGVVDERRELISGRASEERKSTGLEVYGSLNAVEMKNLYVDVVKMDFDSVLTEVRPFYDMVRASQKPNKA